MIRSRSIYQVSVEYGFGLDLTTALSTLQAHTLPYSDAFPYSHVHTHVCVVLKI